MLKLSLVPLSCLGFFLLFKIKECELETSGLLFCPKSGPSVPLVSQSKHVSVKLSENSFFDEFSKSFDELAAYFIDVPSLTNLSLYKNNNNLFET